MSRPLLLFASRHTSVAAALHQHFELFLPACNLPHEIRHIGFSSCMELFATLDSIEPEQLLDTMLVFDISPEEESTWNVKTIQGEQGLTAQLILSYPEIYFVFLETSLPRRGHSIDLEEIGGDISRHHYVPDGSLLTLLGLIRFHAQEFRTLFDATGLRSLFMRKLLAESGDERSSIYKPFSDSRSEYAAVCADEEIAFVYLNGYVAYTAGFRTWLLCTQKEFWRILSRKTNSANIAVNRRRWARLRSWATNLVHNIFHRTDSLNPQAPKFGVILSDWELAYPDHTGPVLKPSLLLSADFKASDKLVVISSFQQAEETRTWSTFTEPPEISRLPKPYGGVFKLLMLKKRRRTSALKERYQGTWKIIINENRSKIQSDSRHSAPYARNLVARRLLLRARVIKMSGKENTESWVQMALLAGTAKEILGEQSRTTAYEAIALQHEAEVNAEMSFFGISTKIELKHRLKMLEQEGQIVQGARDSRNWKGRQEHDSSHLNFMLRAINNLRLRFIEYEQVEATEKCVHQFAWYHHKLGWLSFTSFFRGSISTVFNHILWATLSYPNFATKAGTSIWRLLCLSVLWVALFTVGYSCLLSSHPAMSPPEKKSERLELAAWHSSFTFIELQAGMKEIDSLTEASSLPSSTPNWADLPSWSRKYHALVLGELIIAYLHLGLLVSILYRRITKRAP